MAPESEVRKRARQTLKAAAETAALGAQQRSVTVAGQTLAPETRVGVDPGSNDARDAVKRLSARAERRRSSKRVSLPRAGDDGEGAEESDGEGEEEAVVAREKRGSKRLSSKRLSSKRLSSKRLSSKRLSSRRSGEDRLALSNVAKRLGKQLESATQPADVIEVFARLDAQEVIVVARALFMLGIVAALVLHALLADKLEPVTISYVIRGGLPRAGHFVPWFLGWLLLLRKEQLEGASNYELGRAAAILGTGILLIMVFPLTLDPWNNHMHMLSSAAHMSEHRQFLLKRFNQTAEEQGRLIHMSTFFVAMRWIFKFFEHTLSIPPEAATLERRAVLAQYPGVRLIWALCTIAEWSVFIYFVITMRPVSHARRASPSLPRVAESTAAA